MSKTRVFINQSDSDEITLSDCKYGNYYFISHENMELHLFLCVPCNCEQFDDTCDEDRICKTVQFVDLESGAIYGDMEFEQEENLVVSMVEKINITY